MLDHNCDICGNRGNKKCEECRYHREVAPNNYEPNKTTKDEIAFLEKYNSYKF
jgi:hypothetical protein